MKTRIGIVNKISLAVIIPSIILLSATAWLVSRELKEKGGEISRQLAVKSAETIAAKIHAGLESEMQTARTLASQLGDLDSLTHSELERFQLKAFSGFLTNSDFAQSIWIDRLPVPETKDEQTKRELHTYAKNGNGTTAFQKRNPAQTSRAHRTAFLDISKGGKEKLLPPLKVKNSYPNASACVPILNEFGQFKGMLKYVFSLASISQIVKANSTEDYEVLLTNSDGKTLFASNKNTDKSNLLGQYEGRNAELRKVMDSGHGAFTFEPEDQDRIICLTPVKLGKSDEYWMLGVTYSLKRHWEAASEVFLSIFLFLTAGYLGLSLIARIAVTKVAKPLQILTEHLKRMAKGEIKSFKNDSNKKDQDEIYDIGRSLNKVIKGLKKKQAFAAEIGKGNLHENLKLESDGDVLGQELIRMRDNLLISKLKEDDEKWISDGLAMFANLLKDNDADTNGFSVTIISALVRRLKANQGSIFLIRNEGDDEYLELEGTYAYDHERVRENRIEVGDTLIGQCALEKDPIFLTDIPDGYTSITSGLGEATPSCICIYPLMAHDEVYGVIEIASFTVFGEKEKSFLTKVSDSLALAFRKIQTSEDTLTLLRQSQQQAEELKTQEEEMRQSMEELAVTQEHMERAQWELRLQRQNLQGIVDSLKVNILAFDQNFKILTINKALKSRYVGTVYDVMDVGVCILDLLDEKDKADWMPRYKAALAGKETELLLELQSKGLTSFRYYNVSPIFDDQNEVIGAAVLSNDVTDNKEYYCQRLEPIFYNMDTATVASNDQ
ncbi:hypothetical protein FUAX_22490 [Fulvitalea axinellae]|uniref:GAF domain-containing protein n=1 Tax=Fulvitalea axinellae TaxID=1182444 RepID=A0AAU9CWN7_9BACT|nr:hypothetical protein FUAX_22490 [Fulvitalea axinellae]